jgi:hypothetical protein
MKVDFKKILTILCLFFAMSLSTMGAEMPQWDKVINAIIEVESEGKSNARNGSCVGAMQISPVCVAECNKILKESKSKLRYTLSDRFNVEKSKEMFLLFQSKYNPEGNIEKAIRSWNGGPKYSKRSTERYYRKVIAKM